MTTEFKLFLMDLIKRNYISVFNDESGSEYSIPAKDVDFFILDPSDLTKSPDKIDELEGNDFIISCEYSVVGNIPTGAYRLEYGDTVLETATMPLMSKKPFKPSKTANDLISLARACSKKIIAQQEMAQKRNMIMGMRTNYEQHTN